MTNLNVRTDILILGAGVNAMVCVAFCQHYNLSYKVLALSAGLHSRNRHFTITPTTEKIFKKLKLWNEKDEQQHGYFKSIQILAEDGTVDLDFNNSINLGRPMAWVVDEKFLNNKLDKLLEKEDHYLNTINILKNDHEGVKVEDDTNTIYEANFMLITENLKIDNQAILGKQQRVRNYGQFALVGDLISEKCHSNVAIQWFIKEGILALLPKKKPHAYSVIYSCNKDFDVLNLTPGVDLLPKSLMNKQIGQIESFNNLSSYKLIEKWRPSICHNSIVWLGSAAYSFHPLAGQGLNFAIKNIDRFFEHFSNQKNYKDSFAKQVFLKSLNKSVTNDAKRLIGLINLIKNYFGISDKGCKISHKFFLKLINKSSFLKKSAIKAAS
tara:strand:+ start:469 stop:1614 length:1146 start_codon:yes stop_codon:yes gene_type:complete